MRVIYKSGIAILKIDGRPNQKWLFILSCDAGIKNEPLLNTYIIHMCAVWLASNRSYWYI